MIATETLRALEEVWRVSLGDPWEFWNRYDDVVLFGSRVLIDCPATSDWDVLCVGGESDRIRRERLDVVVVGADISAHQRWVESELASHVLAYGLWIRGRGLWRPSVRISDYTVAEKTRRIAYRVGVLERKWTLFDERFRRRHLRLLRRDMQRLVLVGNGCPVPPGPMLDAAWSTESADAILREAKGLLSVELATQTEPWLARLPAPSRD